MWVYKESSLKIWRRPYLFLQDSKCVLKLTVHVFPVLVLKYDKGLIKSYAPERSRQL